MGCLRITYEYEREGIENAPLYFSDGLEEKVSEQNFCTNYTPFGAVAKVWNNPDQTQQETYRYGYQGQYAEEDTVTGFSSFELRMYDPIIGRWLSPDPYRQYPSPYLAMGNRPVSVVDPDGGCATDDYDCWRTAFDSGLTFKEASFSFLDNLEIIPVDIDFAAGINDDVVSEYSLGEIRGIARDANESNILITSTARDAAAQARAMFNNVQRNLAEQRGIYTPPGQRVLDTYERLLAQGSTDQQIIDGMTLTIMRLGPTNVSRHAANPDVLNVVDISQRTINNHANFQNAANANPNVRVLNENRVFHLEIPQPNN